MSIYNINLYLFFFFFKSCATILYLMNFLTDDKTVYTKLINDLDVTFRFYTKEQLKAKNKNVKAGWTQMREEVKKLMPFSKIYRMYVKLFTQAYILFSNCGEIITVPKNT